MNSLSWMIYLADVVGTAKVMFGLALGGAAAWFVFLQIAAAHAADFGDDADIAPRRKLSFKAFPFAIAFSVAIVLVPSTSTIYAIAASEMGEKVINTPTAGKAIKALDAWLDRQIDGEPAAKKDDSHEQ